MISVWIFKNFYRRVCPYKVSGCILCIIVPIYYLQEIIMKPKYILTKEYLTEHFINQRKSDKKIAEELNIASVNSVIQARRRHAINRCSLKDSSKIITKEFLEEYYIKQNLSLKSVAYKAGFKRKSIISKALKKFGITQREHTRSQAVIERKKRSHHTISGRYFCSLVSGAKRRGLEFNITIEDLWNLFTKQKGKCLLSGIDIRFYKTGEKYTAQTASVDRIDSEYGYNINNIRWVHKTVNNMKWELSDDEFLSFCQSIIKHNRKNKK